MIFDFNTDGVVVGIEILNVSKRVAPDWLKVLHTPAKDYSGSDSFTFKVSDGVLESAQAEVTITMEE